MNTQFLTCFLAVFLQVKVQASWLDPDWSTAKIVHPVRSNPRGQFVSEDLSTGLPTDGPFTATETRRKRQAPQEEPEEDSETREKLYVVIHDDEEELLLQLTPNTKLVTPYTVIEWFLEGGEHVVKKMTKNCFYSGRNIRSKGPSLVAVSNCDGLTGFIRSNNESYFIEPLTQDLKKKLLQPLPSNDFSSHSNYQRAPSEDRRFDQLQKLDTSDNGSPRPHVIYKINSIIDKLNISIGHDQEFESGAATFKRAHSPFGGTKDFNYYFTEDLRVEKDFDDFYKKGGESEQDYDDETYLTEGDDNVLRTRRSVKEFLKGGRTLPLTGDEVEKEVKERKGGKKKRRNGCKKRGKEDLRCLTKRERKARKREARRLTKEKRKKEREQRRREGKRERRKSKKQKKNKAKGKKRSNKLFNRDTDDWQGYSPDLPWETDANAGRHAALTDDRSFVSRPLKNSDPQKWLELAIGVDHSVIDFHGEKHVEKYIFTLFNIVSAIYEDPSLEANLQIVLLRLIFYKDKTQSQVKTGLAKKSLEAVNQWASVLHKNSPSHLKQDVAVWLTRHDLGGPSGYAPVAGVCEPSRSCTLNRDEGLTSAFIIAHEMGHVLGLSHDGDPNAQNTCEAEGRMGSVMAPLVAATFGRFHWSSCSKKEYHHTQKSWECLKNKPSYGNATLLSSSIKYQYTLDEQCRMEFGNGFGLCHTYGVSDPCTFLWCSNSSTPHLCKTKKGPPLEGTTCGDKMWCRNGFCEPMQPLEEDNEVESPPVRHNPQHGGWSEWAEWGTCSRTCGTGAMFRTRSCDKPQPAYGGDPCVGKGEEWKICETKECPEPIDLRALQCNLLSYLVKLGKRKSDLVWLPYEPKRRKKKCRISCVSPATNEVYFGKEFLFDGTRCSYENSDDICVQGKCISLGCDKEIGSNSKRDDCGVCGGDGTTCRRSTIIFRDVPPMVYTDVAILPKGAWKIAIREDHPTTNFLSLRDNSSILVLNQAETQEPAREFISEGTQFHYVRRGEKESIAAEGPLLRPMTVMVHGGSIREEVSITTTYLVQEEEKETYFWKVGALGPCSKKCGGGQQQETLICLDRKNNYPVFDHLCNNQERPQPKEYSCNQHSCNVEWIVGPWEYCTKSCGSEGIQHRVVSCVRSKRQQKPSETLKSEISNFLTIDSNYVTTEGPTPTADVDINSTQSESLEYVDPLLCQMEHRPPDQRPCNRVPCPAYWRSIGWSECSVTCGSGQQEHMYKCEGDSSYQGNEVIYNCGAKPRELRVCFLPECDQSPSDPKCVDESTFCQLPYLHRYCQIPKYYLLCCETCSKAKHKYQ